MVGDCVTLLAAMCVSRFSGSGDLIGAQIASSEERQPRKRTSRDLESPGHLDEEAEAFALTSFASGARRQG